MQVKKHLLGHEAAWSLRHSKSTIHVLCDIFKDGKRLLLLTPDGALALAEKVSLKHVVYHQRLRVNCGADVKWQLETWTGHWTFRSSCGYDLNILEWLKNERYIVWGEEYYFTVTCPSRTALSYKTIIVCSYPRSSADEEIIRTQAERKASTGKRLWSLIKLFLLSISNH